MSIELNAIRDYVRNSGLTQEQWAQKCGLKYWTFQKFMSGGDKDPRTSTFLAIQKAVDQHRGESLRKKDLVEARAG
jgi:predicted transcriptional regulator